MRIFKQWILIESLVLLVILSSGCGSGATTPDRAIHEFFGALQDGEPNQWRKYLPEKFTLSDLGVKRNSHLIPADRRGNPWGNSDRIDYNDLPLLSKILQANLKDVKINIVERWGYPTGSLKFEIREPSWTPQADFSGS